MAEQKKEGRRNRFMDSWRNLTRITTIRIIVQTICFGMFLAFVLVTTFANIDRFPGLRNWVGKILEIDPLVSIATAITTHTVYRGLLWSLIILVPTLFLGRFFCNWICPYGILHHFIGWLFNTRNTRQRLDSNRYRPVYQLKYYILTVMLIAAIFGSLQIGLLDPICLIYRSFTGAVIPAAGMASPELLGDFRLHQGGLLIGVMLFGLVAMNIVIPRFFCRTLCPLGALLGILSRFSWWRIVRDPKLCTDCDLCLKSCEGACDPHSTLRKSECFVCFNCIEDCPTKALSFKLFGSKETEIAAPDVPRRRLVLASIGGLFLYPFMRSSGRSRGNFSSAAIRPPGSTEESEFLERCIKCDQCIRVCPTNVLQPGLFESGFEGLWTPMMNFRVGHCQLSCTACGHVCPTGAIQRISVEEKLGLGEFAEKGPIRLGTAHVDPGRCLPFSKNIPCVVCEEVCPTSPKAIHSEREIRTIREGKKLASAACENHVTLTDWQEPGQVTGRPPHFEINQFRGNETTSYHLTVSHADGTTESHRITGNDVDTVMIDGNFTRQIEPGTAITLQLEQKVPKVDTDLCIGCGLCERECPVVGDRRAIYVTADGETRSQDYHERDRNRTVRLT